jgi:hypothetical protein
MSQGEVMHDGLEGIHPINTFQRKWRDDLQIKASSQ